MPRWTKRSYLVASSAMLSLWCFTVSADFDRATKAYLLGDFEKARYESLVAATDGNPKAQMLMGQLYFNGEGVKKDVDHALYWYEKAADSEFSEAQYRLGILYNEGQNGVKKDLDKAYKWLMKAFDNGYKEASKTLEWLHKSEEGKVYNLSENLDILKKVAATGNKQARYLLSQKMIKGSDVPQDKAGAINILMEDAKQGFIKAQKKLGELYFFGDGVEKNYIEAYGWSMAYAGTSDLGGIAREGKQIARSALRKLPEENHNEAYLKSKDYFEKFVLPFYSNAREVGPDKYRIVVRSKVKKDPSNQQNISAQETKAKSPAPVASLTANKVDEPAENSSKGGVSTAIPPEKVAPVVEGAERSSDKESVSKIAAQITVPSVQTSEGLPVVTSSVVTLVEPEKTVPAKQNVQQDSDKESTEVEVSTPVESTSVVMEPKAIALKEPPKPVNEKGLELEVDAGPVVVEPMNVSGSGDSGVTESVNLPERNFDDVYNVLVRKKSALYRLYKQEYELDKKLQGRMVFEIVIAAEGKIHSVEILSNTVNSPTLEQALIDHLKNNVTFDSMDVADFKISYPVDFLPP